MEERREKKFKRKNQQGEEELGRKVKLGREREGRGRRKWRSGGRVRIKRRERQSWRGKKYRRESKKRREMILGKGKS